jgi:hypothetical protein
MSRKVDNTLSDRRQVRRLHQEGSGEEVRLMLVDTVDDGSHLRIAFSACMRPVPDLLTHRLDGARELTSRPASSSSAAFRADEY